MSDSLNIAALLRAAADGELSPEQQRRLDDHLAAHPEDETRIEFERRLREATSRVMSVETPEGLQERIDKVARVESVSTSTRSFWRRPVVMGAAAAIVIVGVAAALLAPASPIGPPARYKSSLVAFLDREHVRCWVDTDEILDKFVVRKQDALPEAASTLLGRRIELADMVRDNLAGLEFLGAGECAMTSGTPSMHLGFRTDGTHGDAGVAVSLFVRVDQERLPLEEGVTYRLTSERRLSRGVCTIYVWTTNGLLHFLVSDDGGACDLSRRALGAPESVQQL